MKNLVDNFAAEALVFILAFVLSTGACAKKVVGCDNGATSTEAAP